MHKVSVMVIERVRHRGEHTGQSRADQNTPLLAPLLLSYLQLALNNCIGFFQLGVLRDLTVDTAKFNEG